MPYLPVSFEETTSYWGAIWVDEGEEVTPALVADRVSDSRWDGEWDYEGSGIQFNIEYDDPSTHQRIRFRDATGSVDGF
jgi:hypothetical protein